MMSYLEQAKTILKGLTLKEKIGQISQIAAGYKCYYLTEDGDIEFTEDFKNVVKEYGGIGAISGILRADPWSERYYGTGITLEMRERIAYKLQTYIKENTEKKIPVMVEVEASHGLQSLGSVMYPTGLSSAASFNTELYGEMMREVGREIEASENHIAFLTLIDLARDPRWGRSEECLGEDPYLASRMAETAVKNIKKSNVLACAKHFAATGNCEGGINCGTLHIGTRELNEIGLMPAKACVDASCDLLMVAYNDIDGTPLHANRELLTETLRNKWGFDGIVISDGGGVGSVAGVLGISGKEAAMLCIKAGIDLSLADGYCFAELESAVNDGLIDISYIDNACARVIEKKLQLGLFDKDFSPSGKACAFNADKHCNKIAYKMASESITMIKNNGILPLSNKTCVTVIGETANDKYHLLGDYTSERLPEEGVTLFKAVESRFDKVAYVKGWDFNGNNDFDAAAKAAKNSDVIIFTAGGTSRRDFEAKYLNNGAVLETKSFMDCGEGCDVADLSLPPQQIALLKQLKKLGKPIISVAVMGRAYVLSELLELSDAVLVAWYPGQEGGYALADIIVGKVNPSGKLPVTLPTSAAALPVCHDSYNLRRSYVNCKKPILFPFGYGLSYSDFKYSDIRVEKGNNEVKICFNIENISETVGKEVPQIYINPIGDSVKHRMNQLKRFCKLELLPHEKKTVSFSIGYKEIGFINPIEPRIEITVGPLGYEKFDPITISIEA